MIDASITRYGPDRRAIGLDMTDIDDYRAEIEYAPPADDALESTVSDDAAPGVVYAPRSERLFVQGETWQVK